MNAATAPATLRTAAPSPHATGVQWEAPTGGLAPPISVKEVDANPSLCTCWRGRRALSTCDLGPRTPCHTFLLRWLAQFLDSTPLSFHNIIRTGKYLFKKRVYA